MRVPAVARTILAPPARPLPRALERRTAAVPAPRDTVLLDAEVVWEEPDDADTRADAWTPRFGRAGTPGEVLLAAYRTPRRSVGRLLDVRV